MASPRRDGRPPPRLPPIPRARPWSQGRTPFNPYAAIHTRGTRGPGDLLRNFIAMLTSLALASLSLHGPLLKTHTHVGARTPAALAVVKQKLPELPDLPPPTEDGGPLSDFLPVSLILESQEADRSGDLMVGEDAGMFAWENEKMGALGERNWLTFFAAVGTILGALAVLWIYPVTGYGDDFVAWLEQIAGGVSHFGSDPCFAVISYCSHIVLHTLAEFTSGHACVWPHLPSGALRAGVGSSVRREDRGRAHVAGHLRLVLAAPLLLVDRVLHCARARRPRPVEWRAGSSLDPCHGYTCV